jgi:outer membrane lipoprotein-sorting protein
MPAMQSLIDRFARFGARLARRTGAQKAPALLLAAVAALCVLPGIAQAQAASKEETVAQLSQHFVSVPTMKGEFVQFGPNGEQTGGVFYIERPGKIRFNYEKPAAVEVISNGKTVAIHNSKLKTWDFYPLDKTPLKLLLSDKITVSDKNIREVVSEPDLTTVVMGDDSVFGNAVITLMFDPATFDLRQWTIKDSKGKETSVMVFNVQKNVTIPPKLFDFNELEIRRGQTDAKNRG